MGLVENIRTAFADQWISTIYRDKIRSQRTRLVTLDIPQRENVAEIQYTLLGIELKVGKRRFACPDLSTARYMRVFARFGAREFAIPYDITKISTAADELETSWHRLWLSLEAQTRGLSSSTKARGRTTLLKAIRDEITEIGGGDIMPLFDRETKQRIQGQ